MAVERWLSVLGGTPPLSDDDAYMGLVPVLLVIEHDDRGECVLLRFDQEGELAGETWHEGFDDATACATDEFGGLIRAWEGIPADQDDYVAYGLDRFHDFASCAHDL